MVQGQSQEGGDYFKDAGLELPALPLLDETDLPPAHKQPLSPPTPPGPVHRFPEPDDTTGQARRRAIADSSLCGSPSLVSSASLPSTFLAS